MVSSVPFIFFGGWSRWFCGFQLWLLSIQSPPLPLLVTFSLSAHVWFHRHSWSFRGGGGDGSMDVDLRRQRVDGGGGRHLFC